MLRTERLLLRQWKASDLAAFAAMGADPLVMRYFERLRTPDESEISAMRIAAQIERDGFGLWALELRGEADFIGFTGLTSIGFEVAFAPAVEVGWRHATKYWGRGLATEAAEAALRHGFETVGLGEIVAMTVPANTPSRRVMERLGMRRDPADDFLHPLVSKGHAMRPHVLYRLGKQAWQERQRVEN